MENFWTECIKPIIIMLFTWVCSILSPVESTLYMLLWAFTFNIVMGLMASINAKQEKFSFKKFWEAFQQLVFYIVAVAFVFWVGKTQKDPIFYETATKWVTYIVLYAYALNIVKNAHLLWPKAKAITMLYSLMSTKVLYSLKTMLGIKTKKHNNDDTNV